MSQPDPLSPQLQSVPAPPRRGSSGLWAGAILIVVGAYFLLRYLGFLDWLSWELVWPIVLIAIGVYLVIRRWR